MSGPEWGGAGEQPRELPPAAEDGSTRPERPVGEITGPPAGDATGQSDVIEAEVVEEPAAPMLVDQPGGPAPPMPWHGPVARPILAPWLVDAAERKQFVRWLSWYTRHWSGYHGIRAPLYALKALLTAPAGAATMVRRALGWAFDLEAAPLRSHAVAKQDAETYLKLSRQRGDRVRWRLSILSGVLVLLVAGTLALRAWGPWWAQLAAVIAVVLVLAKLGQPADRPIIGHAVIVPKVQRLTSEIVVRALSSLGINATLNKGEGITFPAPIARDGPGWRADVELPFGVTVTEVIDKRDKLASGLRRPLGCCWPEPLSDDHPGRLVLWVGDEDMSKAKQPVWPLRNTGTVDLFQPQPFGTDQRGRYVELTLMFTSVAIGAIPRMGKTFALRELLLIAALDPRAEVHAYDNKGTGDLSPLECVAHRYGVGDDEDEIDASLADMHTLRDELRRRTKVIRNLPRDLCPENKVTPELASKRGLGLHPIVVGVDECQVWFEHPKHGAEFETILTDLVKRGPAVGIILIVATQRPDAKSLPKGISDNVSTRFCLKVMDQVPNDMVLGTSSYKNGIRATMFAWSDKGIGYLRGEGADARITRTVYLDAPTAERIALRARAARQAAGLLTGHAIGEDAERGPAYSFVEDLWAALAADEWLWSEVWVERLGELRPAVYAGWTVKRFGAEVRRELGLEVHQLNRTVDGEQINRYGLTRDDLARAIEAEPRREIK